VKTDDDWVLEFQHSHIKPDERRSREAFYQRLVWVLDGKRRKKDEPQLLRACERGTLLSAISSKRRIPSASASLLRDWAGSRAHVFFDCSDEQPLWWLAPESNEEWAYVQSLSRAQFVKIHRQKEFASLAHNFSISIAHHENRPLPTRPDQPPPRPPTNRLMIRRGFRL
jgi:hypothetical protein